jgi:hypothetical protein
MSLSRAIIDRPDGAKAYGRFWLILKKNPAQWNTVLRHDHDPPVPSAPAAPEPVLVGT